MILNKEVVERLQMGDENALLTNKPLSDDTDFRLSESTVKNEEFSRMWTLHYKAVHNVGSLNFLGPENKEEAFKLGNIYCSKRNWRFIQVRPMFTDISIDPQTEEERARYNK